MNQERRNNVDLNLLKQDKVDAVKSFFNKQGLDKPIVFFDIETTGLSVTKDRIVQLGAVIVNTNDTIDKLNLLINPGMPIPQEAINVHQITNEMVEDAKTFNHYSANLFLIFNNAIVVGFNSDRYDVILLSEEFARAGIAWPTNETICVDVLSLERWLRPRSLVQLHKEYLNEDYDDSAHDALNDVFATINVFGAQLEQNDLNDRPLHQLIAEYNGNRVYLDVARYIAYNDILEPVFTFGKNANQPVAKNFSYVNWMLGQDFPTETKHVLLEILQDSTINVAMYIKPEQVQSFKEYCIANNLAYRDAVKPFLQLIQ